jgi:hypothetical protein
MTKQLKQLVRERARGRCEYRLSREDLSPDAFSLEHIIPRDAGGDSMETDLALACQRCNNHKYYKTHALDPLNGIAAPLFNPRKDIWREHFMWGLTPTSRATVNGLQVNRDGVVNLRRLLVLAGPCLKI